MIDFHSHFLSGIDDGAKNSKIALDMLVDSKKQGVNLVVATPHFRPKLHDINTFIEKRDIAYSKVLKRITDANADVPKIVFGAEIKLGYSLLELDDISRLHIGDTDYLLLELPFDEWKPDIHDLLYSIMVKFKIKPILAHIERYRKINTDFGVYRQFFDMGALMQVNADSFLEFFSKKFITKLYENEMIHLIGSDMHNMDERRSHFAESVTKIRKNYGDEFIRHLNSNAENILFAK